MIQQICKNEWCKRPFDVRDEDLAFYDQVSPVFNGKKEAVPSPNLCPECRQQRRASFRNERNLSHRTCDLTGKPIISMYPKDAPFPVYDKAAWWSDDWDPLSFGREIDFSQPFFAQFGELQKHVPRPSLYQKNVENSDFTNHVENLKNGYLSVDVGANSEGLFPRRLMISEDV